MQTNPKAQSVPNPGRAVVIIKRLLKIGLILLAFVPLLVSSSSTFPFIPDVIFPYISVKMILIRTMITLVSLLICLSFIISKGFRQEIYSKLKRLFHNPIFITAGSFMFLIGLSVLFAIDKYRAFWGNIERAEGFAGIAFYFAFFPLAYLIFKRKDWVWFFKATLVSGLILFVNEVLTLPTDVAAARPGSFTGNPSFLAGFFLFVIAAALIVIHNSKSGGKYLKISWNVFSILMILASIVGIFLTQTRGTILGLVAGVVAVATYLIIRGKGITVYKKLNLRNISLIVLCLLVIFAASFLLTSNKPFWKSVPGMDRFTALTGPNDGTIQTRLISIGIGLNAINPVTNGYFRFLFGWGQENFGIAYNLYYNPRYFEFEQQWFDRAHNKLMDALVMQGALGLLAYLSIWVSFAWVGLKRKEFSMENMALLFFGAAFFVSLLALFDQISTYIPLFAALGFMAFIRDENHIEEVSEAPPNTLHYIMYVAFGIIAAFFSYVLVMSYIAYNQMQRYVSVLESRGLSLDVLESDLNGVLSPYTYSQQDIRSDLVSELSGYYNPKNAAIDQLLSTAIAAEEDVINRDPHDPRQMLVVAQAYDVEGRAEATASSSKTALADFQEAEKYYRMALALAPLRQDVILPLAQNLVYQGRLSDALVLLDKVYNEDPKVVPVDYEYGFVLQLAGPQYYAQALPLLNTGLKTYANNISKLGSQVDTMYHSFAQYFYSRKDVANFLLTMQGLSILEPSNLEAINAASSSTQAGKWSAIDLNSL